MHAGAAVDDYVAFTEQCLEQDGLALVEYALDMKRRHCRIDLTAAEGLGRRSLQLLAQYFSSPSDHCMWEEIDDGAAAVDLVCCGLSGELCGAGSDSVDGGFITPSGCTATCLIALHEYMNQCGEVIE